MITIEDNDLPIVVAQKIITGTKPYNPTPLMKQVAEVLHLLKKEGKTVLVITHDTELVREVADQVVTMKSNSEG